VQGFREGAAAAALGGAGNKKRIPRRKHAGGRGNDEAFDWTKVDKDDL
jgi:hypothetical protein